MAKLVAVDRQKHKDLVFDSSKAEWHGQSQHLIPVVLAEFTHLAVQYPIVLTKDGETGEFVFSALLGFEAGENLFWQDEQWQAIYIPLQIQRQPFFIGDVCAQPTSSDSDFVVCLDVESPVIVSNKKDKPSDKFYTLMTETGDESLYFQQAKQCLTQLLQGKRDNLKLLTVLKKFDLIQPLSLEITFVNQHRTRLNGLYTIDQEKLDGLSSEKITELHQQKLLKPIYTMIATLGQLYALIERKNKLLSG